MLRKRWFARSLEVAALAPERLSHSVLLEEVHLERHLAPDALLLAHRTEQRAATGPAGLLLGTWVSVTHVLTQLRRTGQSHGTLEASVATADTAAAVRLSFLAVIPAGDAAAAAAAAAAATASATGFISVLNWIVGGGGGGGGGVIVSRFDRVDDVNVLVKDGRVAELLVAVVTLGLGVVLLQVYSQAFDSTAGKGLGTYCTSWSFLRPRRRTSRTRARYGGERWVGGWDGIDFFYEFHFFIV